MLSQDWYRPQGEPLKANNNNGKALIGKIRNHESKCVTELYAFIVRKMRSPSSCSQMSDYVKTAVVFISDCGGSVTVISFSVSGATNQLNSISNRPPSEGTTISSPLLTQLFAWLCGSNHFSNSGRVLHMTQLDVKINRTFVYSVRNGFSL